MTGEMPPDRTDNLPVLWEEIKKREDEQKFKNEKFAIFISSNTKAITALTSLLVIFTAIEVYQIWKGNGAVVLSLRYELTKEVADVARAPEQRASTLRILGRLCADHGCAVDIRDVNLDNLDLQNIDLRDARLERTSWRNAQIQAVDFDGACVEDADFARADIGNDANKKYRVFGTARNLSRDVFLPAKETCNN